MSKFRVEPINHPDQAREIEADTFEVDETTGANIFRDKAGGLIARLFNVNVEKIGK